MQDITSGTTVNIKVVKQPTNIAASKTLARILCKDSAAKTENNRQRKVRKANYSPSRRGGRLYGGRVVKQHAVTGTLGETGTVIATTDVLRDLASVARFVEVTKV